MGLMAIAKGKGKGKSKGKGKGNVRLCYSCGKPGHMAASCWSKGKGKGKAKGKGNSVTCHTCGQPGHISPNCPMNSGKGKGWRSVNEVDWADWSYDWGWTDETPDEANMGNSVIGAISYEEDFPPPAPVGARPTRVTGPGSFVNAKLLTGPY